VFNKFMCSYGFFFFFFPKIKNKRNPAILVFPREISMGDSHSQIRSIIFCFFVVVLVAFIS
jgi:hypothetical protein